MKVVFISAAILLLSSCLFSQIDSRRGYEYLSEFTDTGMLYTDISCKNYDNDPVSVVGNHRVEKAFHYSSSYRYGDVLKMISVYTSIAAINYSEFFIYNEFQELVGYAYTTENTEIVLKIDHAEIKVLRENGREIISDNYFLNEPETFLDYSSLKERSDKQLEYCDALIGIPFFEKETLIIREKYKNANSDLPFRVVEINNVAACYLDDKLIKIIAKDEVTKEFYVENDKPYFAFYSGDSENPELRVYLRSFYPYKILLGKESLSCETEEFWELYDRINGDFSNYIELFTNK